MNVGLLMTPLILAAGPSPEAVPAPGRSLTVSAPAETSCTDRVHLVRAERGLPELKRDMAKPDEPLMIAAVDHRIDGCSVMLMHGNTSDVRPLPAPAGPPSLQRAQ